MGAYTHTQQWLFESRAVRKWPFARQRGIPGTDPPLCLAMKPDTLVLGFWPLELCENTSSQSNHSICGILMVVL